MFEWTAAVPWKEILSSYSRLDLITWVTEPKTYQSQMVWSDIPLVADLMFKQGQHCHHRKYNSALPASINQIYKSDAMKTNSKSPRG